MRSNRDIIRATYEGSSEENGKNLLAVLSPEIEWTEAEGFPYAGTHVGVEALMKGVFNRLATEWDGYKAEVHTYLAEGDRVAAFGVYSGTYKATGKSMRSHFAHLYELRGGQIIRMHQYVDTAMVWQAMK
jgi:ketosteroid isomerase-like protein